jgi:DNA phosphorothioation-dependent restriction protein DptF
MAQLDPIHLRSDSIDQALIELNNSTNISMVFKRHLDLEQVEYLENALVDLGPFYELTTATRQLLTATLIRFTFFLSKDMSSAFENETYTSFMSYLYAYNVGVPNQLRGIYEDIENAIFAWQGGPKPNYIYVDNSVGSMKIAQSLNLRKYSKHLIKRDDEILNRFKNTIIIGFQNQSQTEHVLLEIDYPLYETIIKVLKGYRPNKKDKEDAIQFTEFIDRLKQLGNKGELFISDKRNNLLFKLEYDPDFEEFSFKRE